MSGGCFLCSRCPAALRVMAHPVPLGVGTPVAQSSRLFPLVNVSNELFPKETAWVPRCCQGRAPAWRQQGCVEWDQGAGTCSSPSVETCHCSSIWQCRPFPRLLSIRRGNWFPAWKWTMRTSAHLDPLLASAAAPAASPGTHIPAPDPCAWRGAWLPRPHPTDSLCSALAPLLRKQFQPLILVSCITIPG